MALVWPLLDGQVGQEIIAAAGSADGVALRPEQIFQYAIRVRASGVILSHNHLLDAGPSAADHAMTRRLVAAGHLLGIPLRASLVVEPSGTHDLITERWWPNPGGRYPVSA